jgi:Mrp family chromosome partitioning ATPase
MNQFDDNADFSGRTSVAFVAPRLDTDLSSKHIVEFRDTALIDRIVHEIGPNLRTVARRARRFGSEERATVLMLAGCKSAVGCTTTALALGLAASEDGPTVVIDGDVANHGLSLSLHPSPTTGWDDVVRGSARLSSALHGGGPATPAAILPVSAPEMNTNALVGLPRFARLLVDLRRDFHLIVVDAGTVNDGGCHWGPWVDAAVLVCDAAENLSAEWAEAWDLLEEMGGQIMGVIETNA